MNHEGKRQKMVEIDTKLSYTR